MQSIPFQGGEVWKWDHAINPIPRRYGNGTMQPIPFQGGGGGMEMGPCSQSHSKGERYGNGTMQSIPFQGGEVWKWDHAANPIPRGGGMEMGPCSQSHSKGGRYGNGTMQPVDPTTVLYTGMSSTFPNAPAPVRMCVKLNCF